MNKTIIALAIALASASAFAGGNSNSNGPRSGGDSSANAGAIAGAAAGAVAGASNRTNVGVTNSNRTSVGVRSSNHNDNRSTAIQGQLQGQAQGQSVTYNEAKQDYSNTYEEYATAAYAPSINATVPCAIPVTGGLQLPGVGGLSGGSAYVDEGCELRETVRLGLTGDAQSRDMANAVLQQQLAGYIQVESDDAPAASESASRDGGLDGYAGLTGF